MNNIDQELLDSLLNDPSFINWSKQSNRNDIHYWNTWIANNESKIETIDLAKSIIIGIAFKKTTLLENKIENELQKVLNTITPPLNTSKPKNNKKRTLLRISYGIAATIAILLTIFVFNEYLYKDTLVSHRTAYGEIIDLTLPDGTKVVLNGNSEISYSKENERDIKLIGEAYFKVKPIPATKAKFWVTTKDLKIEVYGTQFHVNTREEKTDVTLDEGSISLLLNNGISKKMIPGDFVSFSKDDKVITHKKVVKETNYSLWRKGTYVFNNISLEEVMKNIEYSYGLTTEFTNEKLKTKIITGGIPNENLKICLTAIEKASGIKIIQENNRLIIIEN